MFVLYELVGVFTNLYGGIIAARFGLQFCFIIGLIFQVIGISLLFTLVNQPRWSRAGVVGYISFSQAFSGIAKDLIKISGKSITKIVTKSDDLEQSHLFKLMALLTGTKNSVKGLGFFLGSVLLTYISLWGDFLFLLGMIICIIPFGVFFLDHDLGVSSHKESLNIKNLLKKEKNITRLSISRSCLFCSRAVWFEVRNIFFFPFFLSPKFIILSIIYIFSKF